MALKFRTLVAWQKGLDSADPDQTASEEAVWWGSSLFAVITSILWIPALITNIIFQSWVKVQNFENPELKKFRSQNKHYAYQISTIFSLNGQLSYLRESENIWQMLLKSAKFRILRLTFDGKSASKSCIQE